MSTIELNSYKILQGTLCAIHYGVAIAVIVLAVGNDCESFKTSYEFKFNVWGQNDGDATCEDGCTLSRENYTFPQQLNVNILVAFFSLVSGTNHLVQLFVTESWFEQGYFSIRSIDFGTSAGLMLLANSILFYVPPDVISLTLWFVFQALTQRGGYATEVLLATNVARVKAFDVFCVSGILYVVPWSLLFGTFAMTTQEGLLGVETVNSPPIQVWFFLAWIFQTFMLFPLAMWFKIFAWPNDDSKNPAVCYRYELINSLLSFIAKLPLLAVFAGGSFQRGLFTELEATGNETTGLAVDECPAINGTTTGTEVYTVLFVPMALSLLGAAVVVYLFRNALFDGNWKAACFTVGKSFGGLFLLTVVTLAPALLALVVTDTTAILFLSLTLPPGLYTIGWLVLRNFLFDSKGDYASLD